MSLGSRTVILSWSLAILLPGTVSAQFIPLPSPRNFFSPVGSGARGMGMGGAFIAVADDGTAATFNPAGLANLRRTEVALVAVQSSFRTRLGGEVVAPYRFAASNLSDRAPDFAGVSVPFEVASRNLTLQASYQRITDVHGAGSTLYVYRSDQFTPPDESDLAYPSKSSQSGAFHTISFAGGYQITESLSLGAAVNYWIANWSVSGQSDVLLSPAGRPAEATYYGSVVSHLDQKLRGINTTIGFLLQHSWISVGGVLRTPLNGSYRLSEHDSGTVLKENQVEDPYDFSADLHTKLHWPRSAGLGIAVRPLHGLTLAADITRTNWSQTTVDNVRSGAFLTQRTYKDAGDPTTEIVQYQDLNYFDLSPASDTYTTDSGLWRVGTEYLVVLPKVIIPIRAGHYRDRSAIYDQDSATGRPITAWTVGTGLNFQHLVLDVAGEWRRSKGLTGAYYDLDGNILHATATAPLTEDLRVTRILVSVIYRFDRGDDPIKRALRRVLRRGD